MVAPSIQHPMQVNVLASAANWAWPIAARQLFGPRGVNLMMADKLDEFVSVLQNRRIHTAIIDMDDVSRCTTMMKVIRREHPLLPCIALSNKCETDMLARALQLDMFAVVDKPVDMEALKELLNRLFIKVYQCDIFSG